MYVSGAKPQCCNHCRDNQKPETEKPKTKLNGKTFAELMKELYDIEKTANTGAA